MVPLSPTTTLLQALWKLARQWRKEGEEGGEEEMASTDVVPETVVGAHRATPANVPESLSRRRGGEARGAIEVANRGQTAVRSRSEWQRSQDIRGGRDV